MRSVEHYKSSLLLSLFLMLVIILLQFEKVFLPRIPHLNRKPFSTNRIGFREAGAC